MATYLMMVKYTPEVCARFADGGFESRKAAVSASVKSTGGELVEFWAVNSPEWNVVMVVESDFSGAEGVAGIVLNYGVGHIERWAQFELVDSATADAAISAMTGTQVAAPSS